MLNLRLTLESGQVFLWYDIDDCWYIIDGSDIIMVSDDLKRLESYNNVDKDIFRLEDDIDKINASISKDAIIRNAIKRFYGLRIVRQDPYQCLISFICSSNASIARIRSMLINISKRFGKKVRWRGYEFNLFPEPRRLADASINELLECGLGFRAKYVKNASNAVAKKIIDLGELKELRYDLASEELMRLDGVGNKVCDCILLFALEHLEAFPIDRWIFKILRCYYGIDAQHLTNKTYRMASEKMRGYFGRYAGYAQQYLYCYARNQSFY